ncbi:alpha/beta hydrolase [Herminiimonas sp. CN]|uniref:alpha/beta hydrolase n=1 Tax=Herminiimonas sp. CN TaxID=1349818 RepID=UPI0004743D5C|nr:PHB depolymerase family esterase [Herminiimonas sp. CN]
MQNSIDNVITHTGLPLAHRVRPPQNAAADRAPCLILLHGVGANEAGLAELGLRQDPRLLVVLPRGPIAFGPAQFGWFTVNFTTTGPVINPAQAEQSRQALIDFIGGLPDAHNVDPDRIWIAGFSQGGIMSASVALTRPDKVSGFGILSGRILPEIAPIMADRESLSGLRGYVSHGLHDQKLSIDFARHSQRLLNEQGVALDYHEYPAGHEFNETMQQGFCLWIKKQIDAERA